MTETATIGHNRPPPYDADALAALSAEMSKAADAYRAWKDAGPIADEAAAGKLGDFLTGVRALEKRIDARRVADKKPHDEAGKAVQAAYRPLLDACEKIAGYAKKALAAFAAEEERRRREAAEAERQRAEAERQRMEKEMREAEVRGDVIAEAAAASGLDALDKREAEPERVRIASATGAGRTLSQRVSYRAEVVNVRTAALHFQNAPELLDLLTRLANAEMRAAKDKAAVKIAGVVFHEERSVA